MQETWHLVKNGTFLRLSLLRNAVDNQRVFPDIFHAFDNTKGEADTKKGPTEESSDLLRVVNVAVTLIVHDDAKSDI